MALTITERKQKISILKKEHDAYFELQGNINAPYIPKMAYRPMGKDELHISFFPSELEKEEDIYTEFVSIDYDSEDPKRTLYLLNYNPHWKSEYEIIKSNSGFVRHIVPVNKLTIINDVVSRNPQINLINTKIIENLNKDMFDLPNPDGNTINDKLLLVNKLEEINQTLITLTKVITKLIK
jgi:hypothetical protein